MTEELLYEGKAKKVFTTDDKDVLLHRYKDEATGTTRGFCRLSTYGGDTVVIALPPDRDAPLRYSQSVSIPVGPMK